MTDALIRFLNKKGFLPVLLPQTGLVPPDLYGVDSHRNLNRYGPLKDHLEDEISYEDPEPFNIPDIELVETTRKRLRSATKFLNDALRCIGLPAAPSLDASLVRSTGLRFSLTGVSGKRTPPTKLFRTVSAFKEHRIAQKLIDKDKLHIAYTYLYANKLIMQTADRTAFDSNAAINWGNVVNADGRVLCERQGETMLSFARSDGMPVAFAYQAGRLARRDGKWEFDPEPARWRKNGEGEAAEPSYYLPVRDKYLTLNEDLSPEQVATGGKWDANSVGSTPKD